MDGTRFDAFTRSISSRRTALGGLLAAPLAVLISLATPQEAVAHDFRARCRHIEDRPRREACLRRARAHRRRCHSPQTVAAACAGRCGVWPDRCGRARSCPACAVPKLCLSNGSCSQACSRSEECPGTCGCGPVAVGGDVRQCNVGPPLDCGSFPVTCTSTADCPVGSYCGVVASLCGTNRCVPLCPS